jgi:hypothetical protein
MNRITQALTTASTIGIIHGPSVSREVRATLDKFSRKFPLPLLLVSGGPLKDLPLLDEEVQTVAELLRFCDLLLAFPVLDCPPKLIELPSRVPMPKSAWEPWEAMAKAISMDKPTICWSNAELHELPLWLMPMGGGWWYGQKTTLF